MVIPAAMNLESAAEELSRVEKKWLDDQQKELTSFGDARAQSIGASGLTEDFRIGYALGLQTARCIIQGSAEVLMHGAKPENIL